MAKGRMSRSLKHMPPGHHAARLQAVRENTPSSPAALPVSGQDQAQGHHSGPAPSVASVGDSWGGSSSVPSSAGGYLRHRHSTRWSLADSSAGADTGVRSPYPRLAIAAVVALLVLLLLVIYKWLSLGAQAATLPAAEVTANQEKVDNNPYLLPPGAAASGFTCEMSGGLPVYGVRYVPHLIGEPYPEPAEPPSGSYSEAYRNLHRRDLPLIGDHLGANALSLSQWPTDGQVDSGFFRTMVEAKLCKAVPTFHLAKYYAEALREGKASPRTDSRSPLAADFIRFGDSVRPEVLENVSVVAWTVDLTLDLGRLLPLVSEDCAYSHMTRDSGFQRWIELLHAVQRWVHPAKGEGRSAAPALRKVPLLVPLDLSRISWTEPGFRSKLKTFLRCMGTGYEEGGWSTLFAQKGATGARWLLSFSLPSEDASAAYNFHDHLDNIAEELQHRHIRAVVMLGMQALKRSSGMNPANSISYIEDFEVSSRRYRPSMDDYERVNKAHKNLDGLLFDEWMDA